MTSLRERLRGSVGRGGAGDDSSEDSGSNDDGPRTDRGEPSIPNTGGGSDDSSEDSGGNDDGPRTDRGEPSIPNTGGGSDDSNEDSGGNDDDGSSNGNGKSDDDQDLVDQGPGKTPLTEEEVAEQQRQQERQRQREEQLEKLRDVTGTQGGRVAILEGAAEKLDKKFPNQDIERDEVQVSFEDGSIGLTPEAETEVAAQQAGVDPSAIKDVEETDAGLKVEFTKEERKRRAATKIENQIIAETPSGGGAGQQRELREDISINPDEVELNGEGAQLKDSALKDVVASRSKVSESDLQIKDSGDSREVVVEKSVVEPTGDDATQPKRIGGPADPKVRQARIDAREEFRTQLREETDLPSETISALNLESEQDGRTVSIGLSEEGERTLAKARFEERIEERTNREVDPSDIKLEETGKGQFRASIAEGTFPQENIETDVEGRGGLSDPDVGPGFAEREQTGAPPTLRAGAVGLAAAGQEASERIGDVGGGFVGEGVESARFAIPTGPTSGTVTTLEEISGETDADTLTDTEPETGGGKAAEEAVTGGALGTIGLATGLPLTAVTAGETALEAADFATENPPRESARAAAGATEQFAREQFRSAKENPARTVGSFVGATAALGAASAVGPRTSLATRGVIQPGEELIGFAGNRAVGTVSKRAARRTFPNNEPLIFSEEAAIRSFRSARSRARSAAATVRERAVPSGNRGQFTPGDLFSQRSDRSTITAEDLADEARTSDIPESERVSARGSRGSSPGAARDRQAAGLNEQGAFVGSNTHQQDPAFGGSITPARQRGERDFSDAFEGPEPELPPGHPFRSESETRTPEQTARPLQRRLEQAAAPIRRTESAQAERSVEEFATGTDSELRSAVEEQAGELGRANGREVTNLRTLFEAEPATRPELRTELGSELRTESETETELRNELRTESETRAETRAETEAETEVEAEAELEAEAEFEGEFESEFENEFEQEFEQEFESETELDNENEDDPSRRIAVGQQSEERGQAAFEGDLSSGFFNEFVSQLAGVDRGAPGDEQLEEIADERVTTEALPTEGELEESEEFGATAGFFSGEGTGFDFGFDSEGGLL